MTLIIIITIIDTVITLTVITLTGMNDPEDGQ